MTDALVQNEWTATCRSAFGKYPRRRIKSHDHTCVVDLISWDAALKLSVPSVQRIFAVGAASDARQGRELNRWRRSQLAVGHSLNRS